MPIPAAGATRMPKSWRPVVPLCIYALLAAAPGIMVATHIPEQNKKFFGSNDRAAVWTAASISVASLISLFTTGLVGLIGDTIGRYPVLIVSAFVSIIPMCLNCVFSPDNMWWYLCTNGIIPALVGSAPAGNMAMVVAGVGDLYVSEERAGPMMLVLAMFFIGIMFAIIPGGLKWSNDLTNIVACVMSLVNLLFVWFFVPETLKEGNRRTHDLDINNVSFSSHNDHEARVVSKWQVVRREVKHPLTPLKYVWRSRVLWMLCLVSICFNAPLSMAESISMYFYNSCCDFTSANNGMYLAILGGSYLIISLTVLPLLFKHFHTVTILNIAMVVLIVNKGALAFIHMKWQIFGLIAPLAAFPLLALGLILQLGSTCATASEQGVVMGSLNAVGGITKALGPIVGSQLYSLAEGYANFPALPWVVCAGIALCGSLICHFGLRPVVMELTVAPPSEYDGDITAAQKLLNDEIEGVSPSTSNISNAGSLDCVASNPDGMVNTH